MEQEPTCPRASTSILCFKFFEKEANVIHHLLLWKEANIFPPIRQLGMSILSVAATNLHLSLIPPFSGPCLATSFPREVSQLESSPCFHQRSVKEWVFLHLKRRTFKFERKRAPLAEGNRPAPSCWGCPQGTRKGSWEDKSNRVIRKGLPKSLQTLPGFPWQSWDTTGEDHTVRMTLGDP